MEKQNKHSNDYIGSFSENPHVAQCWTCWLANCNIGKDESFQKEWHQKKTMERKPIEKEFYNDGGTKIVEEMFFCQPCQDSWGEDDSSDDCTYEELGHIHSVQIQENTRPYKVEILN